MAKRKKYNASLGKRLGTDFRSPLDSGKYHLIYGNLDKWLMIRQGRIRPYRIFTTKEAALKYAKSSLTSKNINEIIIHGMNGEIETKMK